MVSHRVNELTRLWCSQTFHYLDVYNQILEYELPRLHAHLQESGIEAQMYAVDWCVWARPKALVRSWGLKETS